MNAQLRFILLILMLVLLLISCKKDDEIEVIEIANHFYYDGISYPLETGFVVYFGEVGPSLHSIGVFLMTDSYYLGMVNPELVTEKGNYVYFNFLSTQPSGLVNGDYPYGNPQNYRAFRYYFGDFKIDYDFKTGRSGADLSLHEGSVNIKRNGTNYEITINCKATNKKNFKGYFKGDLLFLDYSDSDSKKTPLLSLTKSKLI